MKKLGFLTSVLTILLMASCSNKTRSEEITADSTQVVSAMVADGDSSAIWTVETVDAQILRKLLSMNGRSYMKRSMAISM